MFSYYFSIFCNKSLETQSFEKTLSTFQKKFNKNDFLTGKATIPRLPQTHSPPYSFPVGQLLLILVRQGDSALPTKLSGYYVLADLFKSTGQSESPFVPALITAFEANVPDANNHTITEKFFLGQLLVNGTKELGKQTPSQIALFNMESMMSFIKDVHRNSLPIFKRSLNLPLSVQLALPTVIPGT